MATWKKVVVSGSAPELASVTLDTDLAIAHGGTGASTATAAASALGVGTEDSPQFTGIELGHASDTTLTKASSGDIAVEGNVIYRAGGTDVPLTDGGTGASSAAAAATNLGVGTGDAVTFASLKTTGNVSGSSVSTGSFGMLVGDGAGITNLTSAAISTYNTSGDNRIITSVNGNTVQGESGLTFDGSTLAVTGDQTVSGTIKDMAKVSGSLVSTGSFGKIEATKFSGDGSGLTGVVTDVDGLSSSVTAPTGDDLLLISDGTAEKKMTWAAASSSLYTGILATSDVTISSAGLASIGNLKVTSGMLAGSIGDSKLDQISTAGKVAIGALEIDGAAEMDAALDDADLFIVDDGANGTEKSMLASRLPTYLFGKVSGDATITSGGAIAFAANSVDTAHITNLNVTTDKIAADAITAAKIGDNEINSEHYAAASIDNEHLADNAVNTDEMTNAAVTKAKLNADIVANGGGITGGNGTALEIDFTATKFTSGDPTFAGMTITGDLTVQGTTTTLDTQNLLVEDNFIFAATGSAGSNIDGGLIVQSGSVDQSGSAIMHDTSAQRWAVAKGLGASAGSGSGAAAVVPSAFVSTVQIDQATNPDATSGSYGEGEIYITQADDIWIRVG